MRVPLPMKAVLEPLLDGRDLAPEVMTQTMRGIMQGEYTPAQRNCAAIVIGFHWALLVLFMHDYTVLAIFLKNIFVIKCCPESMQNAQNDLINDLNKMIGKDEQKFWGLTASNLAGVSSFQSERHVAAANQLIEHLQNKLPQHVDAV